MSMTLSEFVQTYNGQQVGDNHGNYVGECVSMVKRYAQEVQGVPNADSTLYVKDGAAKNMWLDPIDAELQYYDKVDSPQAGDIAVYTNGTYGDVAICVGNGQVFGQLGTPVFRPAAVRNIGSPTGYLRLKGASPKGEDMPTLPTRDQVIEAFQKHLGKDPRPEEIDYYSTHDVAELYAVLLNNRTDRVKELEAQLAAGAKVLSPGTYKVN